MIEPAGTKVNIKNVTVTGAIDNAGLPSFIIEITSPMLQKMTIRLADVRRLRRILEFMVPNE